MPAVVPLLQCDDFPLAFSLLHETERSSACKVRADTAWRLANRAACKLGSLHAVRLKVDSLQTREFMQYILNQAACKLGNFYSTS
jgi:hypothetical protein